MPVADDTGHLLAIDKPPQSVLEFMDLLSLRYAAPQEGLFSVLVVLAADVQLADGDWYMILRD
jgi:hypothetical protein